MRNTINELEGTCIYCGKLTSLYTECPCVRIRQNEHIKELEERLGKQIHYHIDRLEGRIEKLEEVWNDHFIGRERAESIKDGSVMVGIVGPKKGDKEWWADKETIKEDLEKIKKQEQPTDDGDKVEVGFCPYCKSVLDVKKKQPTDDDELKVGDGVMLDKDFYAFCNHCDYYNFNPDKHGTYIGLGYCRLKRCGKKPLGKCSAFKAKFLIECFDDEKEEAIRELFDDVLEDLINETPCDHRDNSFNAAIKEYKQRWNEIMGRENDERK